MPVHCHAAFGRSAPIYRGGGIRCPAFVASGNRVRRRGSGTSARRSSPDGKRPPSLTCAAPSNMRPPPFRPRRRTRASRKRGWTGCAATFAEGANCRSDPALWKAPASASSEAGSKDPGAFGRRRSPTPCPPPDAALKTGAGPTSSSGGIAASQQPDQRKWTHSLVARHAPPRCRPSSRSETQYRSRNPQDAGCGGWT